jgi:hypothetical protein
MAEPPRALLPCRFRPWRRLAYPLAVAVALAASSWPSARAAAAPLGFGDTAVFAGCLTISAQAYRGRQGDFDNHDWVTVQVENRCEFPLTRLRVELRLIDEQGGAYGRRIWLLGRREFLPPGAKRRERYAIADPDNRIARGWEVVVLNVERAFERKARR